jgi:hypothetical protein
MSPRDEQAGDHKGEDDDREDLDPLDDLVTVGGDELRGMGQRCGLRFFGTVKVWMTKMSAKVSTTMTTPMPRRMTTASDFPAVRLTAATIRAIAPAMARRTTAMVRRVERREYNGLCRHAPHALNRKTTAKMSWNIGDLWQILGVEAADSTVAASPDCTETLVQEPAGII